MAGPKNSNWCRQAIVCLLTILAYISLPLLILLIPVYELRPLVGALAKVFRRDLGKMLSPRSNLFAGEYSEMFTKRTRCAVYVSFVIDISVDLKTFNEFFYEHVVARRRSGSNELQNPELQQTITSWLGYLFWKWDSDFRMENHVHKYAGPLNKVDLMTEEDLPAVLKELAARPFSPGRSPWDIWMWDKARLEGDPEQREKTLYILRVHHSLGDGFSIMRLLVEDIHGTEMGEKLFQPSSDPGLRGGAPRKAGSGMSEKMNVWNVMGTLIKAPYEMVSVLIHSWDFNEWRLPERKLTGRLNAALTPCIPVESIKDIKGLYGTSFTAVILAAFAGGIRAFFTMKDMKVPEKIHCVIPLPMPGHPDKLRNHMTAVIAALPVGLTTPRERILRADATLKDLKRSSIPLATFLSLPLIGGLPAFVVRILATNQIATCLMSIIPGPTFQGQLMGHAVDRIMFGGGLLVGNIGVGMTSLSYNGYNRLGIGIDEGIHPDPEEARHLVRLIERELDQLGKEGLI